MRDGGVAGCIADLYPMDVEIHGGGGDTGEIAVGPVGSFSGAKDEVEILLIEDWIRVGTQDWLLIEVPGDAAGNP